MWCQEQQSKQCFGLELHVRLCKISKPLYKFDKFLYKTRYRRLSLLHASSFFLFLKKCEILDSNLLPLQTNASLTLIFGKSLVRKIQEWSVSYETCIYMPSCSLLDSRRTRDQQVLISQVSQNTPAGNVNVQNLDQNLKLYNLQTIFSSCLFRSLQASSGWLAGQWMVVA